MPGLDSQIDELASGQHGLVTRQQLLELGLTARMVTGRLKKRRLHRVHAGVYRVGPLVAPRSREMAAVLACGPRAAVSRRSAAWLWDLLPPPGTSVPVDVVVVGADLGRRPGIRCHRVALLDSEDVTNVDEIRVTSPLRTLVDLAPVARAAELELAAARAERLGLATREQLARLPMERRGRRGVRALRVIIEQPGGPALTRSEAERLFLQLLREYRIRAPKVNMRIHGYELDFFWPSASIAVEIDGFSYHGVRPRFDGDRQRDTHLAGAGIQVIRLSLRQLTQEPGPTMMAIGCALVLAEAR
jgi:very-short-patch-repair endonuclease